jgi:Fic family protein
MMPLARLPDRLHKRILEKKRRFDSSHPLQKHAIQQVEERMRAEFVYNTNKIEGNTLTRGETELILRGMTVHGKNILDVIAVKNHQHDCP